MGRTARPLNGLEISRAMTDHLLSLGQDLIKAQAIKPEKAETLLETFRAAIIERTVLQQYLIKSHIVYPKVGWRVKVRLERLDDAGLEHALNGECDLDLERNIQLRLQFGLSGVGVFLSEAEDERLSTNAPDDLRVKSGIPVEAEYIRPDGQIGKVRIDDIKPVEPPKRAARTVEVGRGVTSGLTRDMKVDEVKLKDGSDNILTTNVQLREEEFITLPSELPEISLDSPDIPSGLERFQIPESDLLPEPPIVETAPSPIPPPMPGGISRTSIPKAKPKGGR
jgi:hypothetical protein